ncbi:MAG TPA: FecR family protein [Candidatus Cloacimonadota bacterium]|nr:FecR family protein [Candidatus Cloacimonadota bacterium]
MKKLIIIAVLSILAISLLNASAVGLITASKGKVSLTRSAKKISFKIGDTINDKDEIRTGKESFASYKYVDGVSSIKVFSNSYVVVTASRSGKSMNKNANVKSGSVYTKVTPGKKGSMKVTTPTTVASVKGTEVFTAVNLAEEATYIVVKGTVTVEVPETGESKDVGAGETAFVDKDLNLEVKETTQEDLAKLDAAEQQAIAESQPKRIRIQLANEEGQIKYIEIFYSDPVDQSE